MRRHLLCLLLLAATALSAPLWGRADALFDGHPEAIDPLAERVAERAIAPRPSWFTTGSARFDGEWQLATCQMTILGLGARLREDPDHPQWLRALDACADRLVSDAGLAFAADAWGEHGLDDLDGDRGHAYLGYVAMALGELRVHRPDTPHAAVHDRMLDALDRRLAASPTGLIETYPGETYPPDVAAVLGALGQRVERTGTGQARLAQALGRFEAAAVDPASGLLVQAMSARSGARHDAPRASGTALAATFLSYADPGLSSRLFDALALQLRTVGPLGAMREFPPGVPGRGDIDSGPVLLGVSVSATGFAIGASRAHGDREVFRSLTRTAHVFGMPRTWRGQRHFATGGALGDAILLAMFTTPARYPAGRPR